MLAHPNVLPILTLDLPSPVCATLTSARAENEAALLATSPCTDFASANAASATLRVWRVSSATCPTPDIVLSAYLSAICTLHCATETPNGDSDLRSPREAERPLGADGHREKAELGALREIVTELPGIVPGRRTEDAVSSNTVPTAYCELA